MSENAHLVMDRSVMSNTLRKYPALLQSLSPITCVFHVSEPDLMMEGVLMILALESDSSKPDINSLSFLPVHSLLTNNCNRKKNDSSSVVKCEESDTSFICGWIEELEKLGLRERLRDALDSFDAQLLNPLYGEVDIFLERSEAIFDELISVLEQQRQINQIKSSSISLSRPNTDLKSPEYYFALVNQLDSIGWNKVEDIDDSLSHVVFQVDDRRGRQHQLTCNLDSLFPSKCPVFTTDLPGDFEVSWDQNSGMVKVFRAFIDVVKEYQNIWDELDDIDLSTWVIEPSLPARKAIIERRIVLLATDGGLSIVIELDTKYPRGVPKSIRFIGSTKNTNKYRHQYNEYVAGTLSNNANQVEKTPLKWQDSFSIRENLERCYGSLPSLATLTPTNDAFECGICYSRHLGDELVLPEVCCDNKCCSRNYHKSCLFEW